MDFASTSAPNLPVVDIAGINGTVEESQLVATDIRNACLTNGFFYVINHGVDQDLQDRLELISQRFFSLPIEAKMLLRMELGGKAWRGYFPLGDELTSGKPDQKEGLYFGEELGKEDLRVRKGVPLHGPNLFDPSIPEMREVVLDYMAAMKRLGHLIMGGLAVSLGLERQFFRHHLMTDPLTLFRIFHYPPVEGSGKSELWGVGEHTDYGVLTILKQDDTGGLQVKGPGGWIDAPPVEGSFVCNIGDMLDRMTHGLYKSTPHRVKNRSNTSRYSYPFFFDPDFNAVVKPLPIWVAEGQQRAKEERWDMLDIHAFEGTYGQYIVEKVGKVFPDLIGKIND